jgi:hypothetical protein
LKNITFLLLIFVNSLTLTATALADLSPNPPVRSDERARPSYVSPEYVPPAEHAGVNAQAISKAEKRLAEFNNSSPNEIGQLQKKILDDANSSIPQLEPIATIIINKIKSKEVWDEINKNQFAKTQAELLLQSLSQLNVSFYMTPEVKKVYPYSPPFEGRFPWLASRIAIDRSLEFFDSPSMIAPKDKKYLFKLDFPILEKLTPPFNVISRIRHQDDRGHDRITFFDSKAEEEADAKVHEAEERKILDKIRKDPMNETHHMMSLIEANINAPMTDYFRPLISTIISQLKSIRLKPMLTQDRFSSLQANILMKKLNKLMIAGLPYQETMIAIDQAMFFFDCVTRLEPDQKRQDFYHSDRYGYKRAALFNDPSFVLFPTTLPLGFSDFIYTRAAPLGFAGVPFKTVFNDRHHNSPYDFWVHDLNHIFRMSNFNKRALENCGLAAANLRTKPGQPKDSQARAAIFENEWAEYRKWNDWVTQKIWPLVDLPPLSKIDKTDPEWKKKRNLAKLMRLIVFEVFHESAVAPTEAYLKKDLGRGSGQLSTFERVHPTCDASNPGKEGGCQPAAQMLQELEKIRTVDGNLKSGCRIQDYTHEHRFIEYIQDRAVVTLGNVYNKMCYGFYDESENPQAYVVDNEYRSAKFLGEAAHLLYQKLNIDGLNNLGKAEILEQVKSKDGSEELFKVFPTAKGVSGCLEE